ncbi:aminoglycoside adenylyltransferase domain-containing protein [Gracilibacillus xinjiangensis]|uniref:Aminoglycoside adenylyltransferase domain-containing protein n=1 Tax=Gracilibacillus xinjiangensis TaxID=1193282 RepID=A0ABV8WVI5_9BACI
MHIPRIVNRVLNDYIALFNQYFPETMEGLYVHGSIALDAYVDHSSDIDFITVTNRPLTEKDAEYLSSIHSIIANNYPKPEMDGVYIQWKDVGELYKNTSENYFYYNNDKLLFGEYFNFNPVTWWIIQHHGINIIGKDPREFVLDIQPEQLSSYVLDNMNSYWANYIQTAENSIDQLVIQPTETIDFQIEWTVLGLLRQFYTLKENSIVSKLDAGEYGGDQLPAGWHPIIKEAINIRKGEKKVTFRSERERIDHALGFSQYLMRECNRVITK